MDAKKTKSQTTPLNAADKFTIRLIGWLSAITIILINNVLQTVLRRVCVFEKYKSWTEYYVALATKQTFAQFLNSGGIMLLMALAMKNYWGLDGLILSIHQVFVVNAIMAPLMAFLNIPYIIKAFRRFRAKKQAKSVMTQEEANLFFQDNECQIAGYYGSLIKNMFVAALYTPVIPTALIWTIVGNALMFYVIKYNILRRSSVCRSLGPSLAREMTELLEWFLIIYGVATFCFNHLLLGDYSAIDVICLILAFTNAILPMDEINILLFPRVIPEAPEETYHNTKLYFEEDYDRCNPATRDVALEKYENEVRKSGDKKKFNDRFKHKFFRG